MEEPGLVADLLAQGSGSPKLSVLLHIRAGYFVGLLLCQKVETWGEGRGRTWR